MYAGLTLTKTQKKENHMEKFDKLLLKILKGKSDANIQFTDLRQLLLTLGFKERIRGSHHLFRKFGIEEKINVQKEGNNAKPYQVRQIRNVIIKYGLGDDNQW